MSTIEDRIQGGMQYRDLRMQASAADEGADSYVVEGYASTFNQPYILWSDGDEEYREQVDAHAFDGADLADVIMQYDHNGRVFARTRNNTLELRTDEQGLFIHANLGGTEEGRKLHSEIRGGYIDRMSFAFTVRNDTWESWTEVRDGAQIRVHLRTILNVERVYDVSAVSMPANDFTSISARSLIDGCRAREAAEAAKAESRAQKIKKIKIFMEATK